MAVSVMQGNELLAKAIRERRLELELTVEAVAVKAGVGSKSWSRYEAGASIRKDKVRGLILSDTYHFEHWMEEQFYCDQ